MAIADNSVIQINGAPAAGRQPVEVFDQLPDHTWAETNSLLTRVNKMGWEICDDTLYTSGSPLAVNNSRVQLTCNGLGSNSNNTYLPAGVSELWNTTTNKIESDSAGNAFDVRIQFTADPSAVSSTIDLELDIGTGAPDIVISSQTVIAPKGTSPFAASVSIPLFSLSTFVANGCKIYLNTTSSGDSFDIYDISIFVKQDYYAT